MLEVRENLFLISSKVLSVIFWLGRVNGFWLLVPALVVRNREKGRRQQISKLISFSLDEHWCTTLLSTFSFISSGQLHSFLLQEREEISQLLENKFINKKQSLANRFIIFLFSLSFGLMNLERPLRCTSLRSSPSFGLMSSSFKIHY